MYARSVEIVTGGVYGKLSLTSATLMERDSLSFCHNAQENAHVIEYLPSNNA